MTDLTIRQAYDISSPQPIGVDGYYVQNKYLDSKKLKHEKEMIESLSSAPKRSSQPKSTKHKQSFFADLEKASSSIPSPDKYSPRDGDFDRIKPPVKAVGKPNQRVTFIGSVEKQSIKDNYPSSQSYTIKDPMVDLRHKSSLSKAQVSTFAADSMAASFLTPGVGQYNVKNTENWQKCGLTKWKPQGAPKRSAQKLPPVGYYSPRPISYSLFDSTRGRGYENKNGFGTSPRFRKEIKPVVDVSYHISSQWGIKNNKNNDIFNKLSKGTSSSVYY